MKRLFSVSLLTPITAIFAFSSTATAQSPPISAASSKLVLGTARAEVTVNKPIDEVWSRVGDFCDIRDWVGTSCDIVYGKENEIGTVRTTGNEIIVGKTKYSYTYGQVGSERRPYRLYHGTLEAQPTSATSTKLIYTFLWDDSGAESALAREKTRQQRAAMALGLLTNMKTLAEVGTVVPF
ncbi:SRPBCC family protein [Rhizorhabdus sp.]|uniref:SRPBCC family protein n=1 Tax=Rhizorhabdus sp. TaxID=1968843 RepID=UPI0019ABC277|nr:SRPBCC family protein [Rhizorhabdus sp.]MBD3759646.1 SRPBCC family protein [Rhizorhabdus sp.]